MPNTNSTENLETTDSSTETQKDELENSSGENSEKEVVAPTFTVKEDYEQLMSINLYKEVAIKLQFIKHPNPEIDALLERRIDLSSKNLLINPFGIRVLSSIVIIFLMGILIWSMIWVFGTILGLTVLAKSLSSLLAILVISGMSISIFQPLPVIDEEQLNKHIVREMNRILESIEKNE